MNGGQLLHLRTNAERLRRLLEHLASHTTDGGQRLAALSALQTFISSSADAGEQAGAAYAHVRTLLLDAQAQARDHLLQDKARDLAQALTSRDAPALARVYRPLSRSGFWEILPQAVSAQDAGALRAWAEGWMEEAKRRGERASGYPDAMDFAKAGIDVAEYSAMDDLLRFLSV
jgi:hypothetical protein